ncbi:hypothetical protein BCU50_023665, partial [Vibrio sp. 10N.286.46.E10]
LTWLHKSGIEVFRIYRETLSRFSCATSTGSTVYQLCQLLLLEVGVKRIDITASALTEPSG